MDCESKSFVNLEKHLELLKNLLAAKYVLDDSEHKEFAEVYEVALKRARKAAVKYCLTFDGEIPLND